MVTDTHAYFFIKKKIVTSSCDFNGVTLANQYEESAICVFNNPLYIQKTILINYYGNQIDVRLKLDSHNKTTRYRTKCASFFLLL